MPSGAVSPTTWPQLVGAVQKASADASAARAEAAKATERVKNLEAKLEALDSQREPSIGPAPTPKKTSCVLRNTKLEVSLEVPIFIEVLTLGSTCWL